MEGINISSGFLLNYFDARHHHMMLADEAFVQKLKELLEGIGLMVDKFIVLNILMDGRYHIATYFRNYLTQEVTIHTDIDFDEVFSNAIVVVGTGTHFELLENVRFDDIEGEIEEKQDDFQEREDEEMARQLQEQIEQQERDEEMARQLQERIEQQERDEEMARQLQEQERAHITEEERRRALTRSVVPTGLRLNQDVLNYNPPPPRRPAPSRRQRTYLTERERYELLSRLFDN